MQVFSSRADRRRGLFVALLVVAVVGALTVVASQYAPILFNADALREWIAQFGVLAPFVFIFIQATQVVVAPIPGQVVALVAGYLFGPGPGTVYSLTGVLIGSAIAFSLAKHYGRSFVEDVLHEDVLTRFDGFVDRVGIAGLFVFVIIPGLPDDAICFLCGLTTWRLRTFLVVISIGRLPAYVLTVYAGGELASGQFLGALALIGIVVALSAIGYSKQDTIRELVQRVEPQLPF